MISREGFGALCGGSEPVSCFGSRLPDDPSSPRSSVLHTSCATKALDFP